MRGLIWVSAVCCGLSHGAYAIAQQPILQGTSPAFVTRNLATIASNDLAAWRTAEATNTRAAYGQYLLVFPNGWFKSFATERVEPGLPEAIAARPVFASRQSARSQAAITAAWQAVLWQGAQTAGTNAAYRDYLLLAPLGENRREALEGYLARRPSHPTQIAPDCELSDTRLKLTRMREGYMGDFPDQALKREIEDIATGDIIMDHTGVPLAWTNVFHVYPEVFARNTERTALNRRYRPLRAGCIDIPSRRSVWSNFQLADRPNMDIRPTLPETDLLLSLNVVNGLELPPDRALRVTVPHDGSRAIYIVEAKAGFPLMIRHSVGDQSWQLLANNKHFKADGPNPVYLRVSAPSQPTPNDPSKAQLPPHQGPVTISIRRIYRAESTIVAQDQTP
jgi:hypothetical protein